MCLSGCSAGTGSKTLRCRLHTWHYLHYLDVNSTSLVTSCQLIKNNHLYVKKLHEHEENRQGMSWISAPRWTIRNKSRHVCRVPRCHPISGWAWSAAWIHSLLGVCTLSMDQQLPPAAVRGCSLWKIQQNWSKQHTTKSEQVRKKWPPQRGLQHWFIQKSSNWIQPVHPDSCQCFINHNRIHGWITEWAHRAQAQGHKGSRGHLVLCLMWLCCEEKKETPTKRC